RDVIQEGARRLVAYQSIAYAQVYIDRLAPIRIADERSGAGGKLLREVGRYLPGRLSYEDGIRAAQAKNDPARRPPLPVERGGGPAWVWRGAAGPMSRSPSRSSSGRASTSSARSCRGGRPAASLRSPRSAAGA